jgi:hypothetical protein
MKSKADYEGRYRIKAAPHRPTAHSAVSWREIERVIAAGAGKAEFDALASAVIDHRHGTKTAAHPCQFITYCIRRGWWVRDGK